MEINIKKLISGTSIELKCTEIEWEKAQNIIEMALLETKDDVPFIPNPTTL